MNIAVGIDIAAKSFDMVVRKSGKPGKAASFKQTPEGHACMLSTEQLIKFLTSYWGSRSLLEAALTDLVCRAAPRLITNLEEYPEAGVARFRIARSRQYQVRGRGTGGYCGLKYAQRKN